MTGRRTTEEIPITPEMIEAGVDALGRWETTEDASLIVFSVFRAMADIHSKQLERQS